MTNFWHPFANMGSVSENELRLVRGEGCYVFDAAGRRMLDAAGGLWYCAVGHARAAIADAAAAQMRELESCSCFEDVVNQPAAELASRVAELAPIRDAKVFFTSGGSDAVDTAAKLARRYWNAVGQPSKLTLISRHGSYHGAHTMGTSLAGIAANREGYGRLVPDVVRVPPFDAKALADTIDRMGAETVAAFYAEPVINAGVLAPPDDYLAQALQVCRERQVLFIADEVVTGFGRLGRWFACERFGIDPDMILFAKGVTSGYLPLGGVIAAPRVWRPFWTDDGTMFRHGYTYSGHATVCAAGLANLEILEQEQLPQRAAALEAEFATILKDLEEVPGVSEVRAIGLAAAIQIDPEVIAHEPRVAREVILALRGAGVLTRMLSGFSLQVSPPLTITAAQVDEIADGVRAALTAHVRAAV